LGSGDSMEALGKLSTNKRLQVLYLSASSLFVTSYVPLRLISQLDESKIIWKNPRPSSTRFCRPIRFQFKKETTQFSIDEEKYFKDKIDMLRPTILENEKKR